MDRLRLVGIRHIMAPPYPPQANDRIERYHRTIKGEISLVPYDMPGELKKVIKEFVEYYNYRTIMKDSAMSSSMMPTWVNISR